MAKASEKVQARVNLVVPPHEPPHESLPFSLLLGTLGTVGTQSNINGLRGHEFGTRLGTLGTRNKINGLRDLEAVSCAFEQKGSGK
jgi:hypothetical protein